MRDFADVIRNQPNKYVNSSKMPSKQEVREESEDYGFFDGNDGQDPEAWGNIEDFDEQDKPYDCYVGTASTARTHRPEGSEGRWNSFDPLPQQGRKLLASTTSAIEAAKCDVAPPATDDLDSLGGSMDSYILVDDLPCKFRKCVELLKNVSSKDDVLVIVDGQKTKVPLMVAFLCLSGITAAKAGQRSAAVQVATRDELRRIKREVDLVINFSMFSSLKELSERGSILSKDGTMKTLLIDSLDKEKAEKFAAELFKVGLSVPIELESYLV